MKRREFLSTFAATGVLAVQNRQPSIQRRGRIKQGLWRTNFGTNTTLSFDDMCREAARLGCYGFDLIGPDDWPTLRRHGLEPLLAGSGGVNFQNGIIHPEAHDSIEESVRGFIDLCADNGVGTMITIGGQRRGMSDEESADNAVAFLNRIKGQLEARNVTIGLENMNNRYEDPRFGRVDQICGHFSWGVDVCKRVDSSSVKMVCDIYHLQIMDGNIVQNIRENIDWIAHFHTAGVPTRNELDYTQEINYRFVAEAIADTGYTGYVSHEFRPGPGRDPLESIAQAVDIMDV